MRKKKSKSTAPTGQDVGNFKFKVAEVDDLPVNGEMLITPDLVICLNLSGQLRVEYDLRPSTFLPGQVTVVLPNHPLMGIETSADYRAIRLNISYEFFTELKSKHLSLSFIRYRSIPCCTLTKEQASALENAIRLLDQFDSLQIPDKDSLTLKAIEVITSLIDGFFTQNNPSEKVRQNNNERIFDRFYTHLTENYASQREIKFYARKCGLTPKYFAGIIKEETGTSASQWISNFVTLKAKSLLSYRNDLSIKQVAVELGFPDQTSFSRYFHRCMGVSPSDYRKSRRDTKQPQ